MPHSSKEVIQQMDKNQLRQLLLRLVAHTHSNKKKSKKNNFDQHRRTKAVFSFQDTGLKIYV